MVFQDTIVSPVLGENGPKDAGGYIVDAKYVFQSSNNKENTYVIWILKVKETRKEGGE